MVEHSSVKVSKFRTTSTVTDTIAMIGKHEIQEMQPSSATVAIPMSLVPPLLLYGRESKQQAATRTNHPFSSNFPETNHSSFDLRLICRHLRTML